MFGVIWDIYTFSTIWVIGPSVLTFGSVKALVANHRRKKKKAPLPMKYVSGTALERKIDIGTVGGGSYGNQSVSVAVNVRTMLDDTLERVVSRRTTGSIISVNNFRGDCTYAGHRHSFTGPVEVALSPDETEKLTSMLTYATVEQDAIDRGGY